METLDNKIIFASYQDCRTTVVTCSAESSVAELADVFLDFLNGSGFSVSAQDLADIFEEKAL